MYQLKHIRRTTSYPPRKNNQNINRPKMALFKRKSRQGHFTSTICLNSNSQTKVQDYLPTVRDVEILLQRHGETTNKWWYEMIQSLDFREGIESCFGDHMQCNTTKIKIELIEAKNKQPMPATFIYNLIKFTIRPSSTIVY